MKRNIFWILILMLVMVMAFGCEPIGGDADEVFDQVEFRTTQNDEDPTEES